MIFSTKFLSSRQLQGRDFADFSAAVDGGGAREQETQLYKGKIMNVNSENNYIINLGFYFGPVRNPYRRVLLTVSYTNRTWLVGFCCCFCRCLASSLAPPSFAVLG